MSRRTRSSSTRTLSTFVELPNISECEALRDYGEEIQSKRMRTKTVREKFLEDKGERSRSNETLYVSEVTENDANNSGESILVYPQHIIDQNPNLSSQSRNDENVECNTTDTSVVSAKPTPTQSHSIFRFLAPKTIIGSIIPPRVPAFDPTKLLISNTTTLISQTIFRTLEEMKVERVYKGLYLWDNEVLSSALSFIPNILQEDFSRDIKIFTFETDAFDLEIYYAQLKKTMTDAIIYSELQPCILFIPRLDMVWQNIDEQGQVMIEPTLVHICMKKILLLATADTELTDESHSVINKLFLTRSRIIKVPRPQTKEKAELLLKVFTRRPEFKERIAKFIDPDGRPILDDCVDCVKNVLGPEFGNLMDTALNILETSHVLFILHVYELLCTISSEISSSNTDVVIQQMGRRFCEEMLKARLIIA